VRVKLIKGDITTFDGDAIVNAANEVGLGGGGVDGAIHRAAGPQLRAACEMLPVFTIRPRWDNPNGPDCEIRILTGAIVPTPAFGLPCEWVIHTVGPVWPEDDAHPRSAFRESYPTALAKAEEDLSHCYWRAYLLASAMGLKSIAYPAISTGVYGCPQEVCAKIALLTLTTGYLPEADIDIYFYLFKPEDLCVWQEVARNLCLTVEE